MNVTLIVTHLEKNGEQYDVKTDWQLDIPNRNSVHPDKLAIKIVNYDEHSKTLKVWLEEIPDYVFLNDYGSVLVTSYDMRKCSEEYKLVGGLKQYDHLRKGVMVNS